KFGALTSKKALQVYEGKYCRFSELQELDLDKINAIINSEMFKPIAAEFEKPPFVAIKDLDVEAITALTSKDVLRVLQGGAEFDVLSKLYTEDNNKFGALTSKKALQVYEGKYCSFSELQELGLDKINAIIDSAMFQPGAAKLKKPPFAAIKDLDVEVIKEFTSLKVLKALGAGVGFKELQELYEGNTEGFVASTTFVGLKAALEAGALIEDFIGLDAKKFNFLVGQSASNLYGLGILFSSVRELTDGKNWYAKGKAFTESNFMTHLLQLRNSKKEDANQLPSLFANLLELYNSNNEKFNALTSGKALRVYNEKYCDLNELKELDLDKIKAIINSDMFAKIFAIPNKPAFSEIKDLTADKIKVLTSSKALEKYKAGANFADLKGLSVEGISRQLESEEPPVRPSM
ncbi:MAG: hypothetical protein KKE11_07215, partial [Gammaproteobacteria bacterium]|nr:hypothetical protein [Gammaproteobacteria bacterium]